MKNNEEQPNYEKLRIWQEAMNLVEIIYQLTKKFPREEMFGVTSQLRRAAVSVPTNIAEGHGKSSRADFGRFLAMSKGSLQEIDTLLQIALRMNYVAENQYTEVHPQILSLVRQVSSLIRNLKSAK